MKLKTFNPLFLSLCVTLPSGCFTTHKEESTSSAKVDLESDEAFVSQQEAEAVEIDEAIDTPLQAKADENIPEIGTEEDEINQILKSGIPVELNEKVQKWIDFFANKNSEAFQRFMDRGQPYKKLVLATLRDRGIPTELYYLAMIESGFVLHAKSPMSAVGFWQFMPATGRRYGLRVDNYVDERRDPRRATIAASMYLSDLNNVFDSWYLAMAAYNAGEMRIMNAIMRGKTRDFWQLVKGKQLPPETMDYIPKFLAAFIIGSSPEKYGFRRPKAESWEDLVAVPVPSPLPLASIAEQTEIPLSVLQQSNPHLNKGMTPPGNANYKIWVPTQYKELLQSSQDKLASLRMTIATKLIAASKGTTRSHHRVHRGENLASIAGKYDMTIAQLKTMNNLRGSQIRAGMKLKIKPIDAAGPASNVLDESVASNDGKASETIYRVRRGDNLHDIAQRFGMSVNTLKKINKLRRTDLRVGQILRVAKNS